MICLNPVMRAADVRSLRGGTNEPAALTDAVLQSDLLARVIDSEKRYANVQSFVCKEEIRRFTGSVKSAAAHRIDTVTAKVSFEDGREHYSQIDRKGRAFAKLSELRGIWSEGEFGSMLGHALELVRTERLTFENWEEVDGTKAAKYDFEVPESKSSWRIYVLGRDSGQHYALPFQATVWISADSGEIVKITEEATNVVPELGAREIKWTLALKPVELSGERWLLPQSAEYEVVGWKEKRMWNAMTFSEYRRYGAEAKLRFE